MVMPHGRHIYDKSYNMENSTMCAYPQSDHSLTHWKRFMRCCAKCPSFNLPDQEKDGQYSEIVPSIRFHIYHIVARCSTHRRLPLNDRFFCKCKHDSS